jgi:hypothetical protein
MLLAQSRVDRDIRSAAPLSQGGIVMLEANNRPLMNRLPGYASGGAADGREV